MIIEETKFIPQIIADMRHIVSTMKTTVQFIFGTMKGKNFGITMMRMDFFAMKYIVTDENLGTNMTVMVEKHTLGSMTAKKHGLNMMMSTTV